MEFGWFEVEVGVFEGGTHFGAVFSEDSERDLVPDDRPVRMSMQEMVMSTTQQHAIRDAGLTTMFPIFHVMGLTPSRWDLTPRPRLVGSSTRAPTVWSEWVSLPRGSAPLRYASDLRTSSLSLTDRAITQQGLHIRRVETTDERSIHLPEPDKRFTVQVGQEGRPINHHHRTR